MKLRPEIGEVLRCAECVQICKDGVALEIARLIHAHTRRTVRHLLHLLPYVCSRVGEIDAVAERLRHLLLAVRSREAACRSVLRQHDVRLDEHLAVYGVEAANQLACHLNHRLLILSCRHRSGLEERDVGSLADGIAEEAKRNVGLKVAHLYLGLHGRVALHTRHGDEVHEVCGEFGELRNLALDEERTLRRVETCREIVESHLNDVLTDFLRIVRIVGQGLNVSHEHKHTVEVASVLKFHAAAQ